ncbi:hypothetical protein HAX54_038033 [Datura stramonium]|uniref:F-box domain-containing protein n=1 Tax=Datura stramonium TaxID=4076 RepID=A0ABS8SHJ3_DATST|nr:hypothetical protein [Datura stramonium]
MVLATHMDPKIWSRLPEDVLEYLLSFLPLKTFLKLRSTCKHFKTLLFSPPFISKHSPSSSSSSSNSQNSSPFFFIFTCFPHPQFPRQYPLFDTVHHNWRNLSLCVSPVLPSSSSVLLSSSNGLLCFTRPSSNSFTVTNVLARSSRPDFVYDSLVHSWSQFGGFDLILNENHHQEGVFHDGHLYFITPEPYFVVCMDLNTGEWKRSNFELPTELTFARLVSDGDKKLYLISGNGSNGISRSMKLWELDGNSRFLEGLGIGFQNALRCLINGAVDSDGFLCSQAIRLCLIVTSIGLKGETSVLLRSLTDSLVFVP